LAVAIEDAGFEIRDNIAWLYGSGFPKSHNISKAIDKLSSFQGEIIGTEIIDIGMQGGSMHAGRDRKLAEREIRELSPEAKAWDGWGTALKPAHEPIVVARKPVIGTVAENVLKHGTGALNIDASRIGTDGGTKGSPNPNGSLKVESGDFSNNRGSQPIDAGRWPANIILDEYTAELLDQQSGVSKSLAHNRPHDTKWGFSVAKDTPEGYDYNSGITGYSDSGGASRFFYVAKASKRDRNEGLEELPIQRPDLRTSTGMGTFEEKGVQPQRNFHPTVKPTALMQYLIRLVTPDNGVVLDPFCGSGSTGKAAILENKSFIGIELTPEYLPIIQGRLEHAYQTMLNKPEEDDLFA
jgi:site-specific DNA-methyltransferase (adenine-specific)